MFIQYVIILLLLFLILDLRERCLNIHTPFLWDIPKISLIVNVDDKIGDFSLLHVLEINLIYLSNIKSINQPTFTTTTYHINNMCRQYCKMDINVVMSLTSERKRKWKQHSLLLIPRQKRPTSLWTRHEHCCLHYPTFQLRILGVRN